MFSSFHFQTIYEPIRVLYGRFYIYIFLVQVFCAAKVVHMTNLFSAMSKLSITKIITKSCFLFSDSQGNSIVFIGINCNYNIENHQNYMNFTGFLVIHSSSCVWKTFAVQAHFSSVHFISILLLFDKFEKYFQFGTLS